MFDKHLDPSTPHADNLAEEAINAIRTDRSNVHMPARASMRAPMVMHSFEDRRLARGSARPLSTLAMLSQLEGSGEAKQAQRRNKKRSNATKRGDVPHLPGNAIRGGGGGGGGGNWSNAPGTGKLADISQVAFAGLAALSLAGLSVIAAQSALNLGKDKSPAPTPTGTTNAQTGVETGTTPNANFTQADATVPVGETSTLALTPATLERTPWFDYIAFDTKLTDLEAAFTAAELERSQQAQAAEDAEAAARAQAAADRAVEQASQEVRDAELKAVNAAEAEAMDIAAEKARQAAADKAAAVKLAEAQAAKVAADEAERARLAKMEAERQVELAAAVAAEKLRLAEAETAKKAKADAAAKLKAETEAETLRLANAEAAKAAEAARVLAAKNAKAKADKAIETKRLEAEAKAEARRLADAKLAAERKEAAMAAAAKADAEAKERKLADARLAKQRRLDAAERARRQAESASVSMAAYTGPIPSPASIKPEKPAILVRAAAERAKARRVSARATVRAPAQAPMVNASAKPRASKSTIASSNYKTRSQNVRATNRTASGSQRVEDFLASRVQKNAEQPISDAELETFKVEFLSHVISAADGQSLSGRTPDGRELKLVIEQTRPRQVGVATVRPVNYAAGIETAPLRYVSDVQPSRTTVMCRDISYSFPGLERGRFAACPGSDNVWTLARASDRPRYSTRGTATP
jgi:hypothetical protein